MEEEGKGRCEKDQHKQKPAALRRRANIPKDAEMRSRDPLGFGFTTGNLGHGAQSKLLVCVPWTQTTKGYVGRNDLKLNQINLGRVWIAFRFSQF